MRGSVLGIEIDGTFIKLMEIRRCLGKKEITKHSILAIPKQSIVDGMICNEEMIYQIIANELKIRKYRAKKVIYIVHSSLIFERQILMEVYKKKTIRRLLEIRAEDYIPVKGSEYEIDFSILGQTEEEGRKKKKILIAAVPKRIIMPLMKLSNHLKLMPVAVTVPAEALVTLSKQISGKEEEGILFIDIKDEITALTIIHRGEEYINSIVHCGMGEFKDINRRIQLSEFINRIRPNMERFLVPEIEKILEIFCRKQDKRLINKVYLIGEEAKNSKLQEYIGDVLNKPVENIEVLYNKCGMKHYIAEKEQYLLVHLVGVMQGI